MLFLLLLLHVTPLLSFHLPCPVSPHTSPHTRALYSTQPNDYTNEHTNEYANEFLTLPLPLPYKLTSKAFVNRRVAEFKHSRLAILALVVEEGRTGGVGGIAQTLLEAVKEPSALLPHLPSLLITLLTFFIIEVLSFLTSNTRTLPAAPGDYLTDSILFPDYELDVLGWRGMTLELLIGRTVMLYLVLGDGAADTVWGALDSTVGEAFRFVLDYGGGIWGVHTTAPPPTP